MHKGHYREAYDSAAFGFQAQQNPGSFEAIARDLGLGEFNSCTWALESSTAKEARLKGEFIDKSNKPYTIEAIEIPERGHWRIFSLSTIAKDSKRMVNLFNRHRGASFNETSVRVVPDDKQLAVLVGETMQGFNDGLHRKSFTLFYQHTSLLWQSQTSEEQVERAFKTFTESNITMDNIKDMKPVFEEKRLDSEGALLVKGYYPTAPNRVLFDLKYTYELPKWKLLGITVSIKP